MNHFGSERQHQVDTLVEAFDRARTQKSTSLISIEAESGWGKTRLIQEWYSRLASDQTYWPKAMIDTESLDPLHKRKLIYPAIVEPESGALIPWMWWGVQCDITRSGGLKQALAEDLTQLSVHQAALVARAERKDLAKEAIGSLLSFSASMFIPSAGDLIGVIDLSKSLLEAGRAARSAGGAGSRRLDGNDTERSDLVGSALGLVNLLGEAGLPLVVVVEDAHHADPSLLAFLDALLSTDRDHGCLIVTLSIPEDLRKQRETGGAAFGSWIATIAVERPTQVSRVALERLADSTVRKMVVASAPHTDPATVEAIARRADGNPLILESLLICPRVRLATRDGRIDLTPSEVSELPQTHRGLLQERWEALDFEVQLSLGLAAMQGRSFVRRLAEEIFGTVQPDVDAPDRVAPLELAIDPIGWVRELEGHLTFHEAYNHELALEGIEAFVGRTQLASIYGVLADRCDELRRSGAFGELPSSARLLVLEVQVNAAIQPGVASANPDRIQAAGEAMVQLSPPLADFGRASEAAEMYTRLVDAMAVGDLVPPEVLIRHQRNLSCVLQVGGAYLDAAQAARDGLAELDRRGIADPGLEFGLRTNLGLSLRLLGAGGEALIEFEKAQSLADDLPGERASVHLNLAGCHLDTDRLDDAVHHSRTAIELASDSLDSGLECQSRSILGLGLARQDLLEEARSGLETAVEQHEEYFGPGHRLTIHTRNNLGWVLSRQRRFSDAAEVIAEGLASRTIAPGVFALEVIEGEEQLAIALEASGDQHTAAALRLDSIKRREMAFGPADDEVIRQLFFVTNTLFSLGRTDEALDVAAGLRARLAATVGPDSPKTLAVTERVTALLARVGRTREAIEMGEAALVAASANDSAQQTALGIRGELTRIRIDAGDVGEALGTSEGLWESMTELHGPSHVWTNWAAEVRSDALVAAERTDEALALLRANLEQAADEGGAESRSAVRARFMLIDLLLATDRADDAMHESEAGLMVVRRSLPPDHPDRIDSFIKASETQEACGLLDQAGSTLDEIISLELTHYPEGNSKLSHAKLRRGRLLTKSDPVAARTDLSAVVSDSKAFASDAEESRRLLAELGDQ